MARFSAWTANDRLWVAVLVSPPFGLFLLSIGAGAVSLMLNGWFGSLNEIIEASLVIGVIVGWPAMLLLGLPTHALLCKIGRTSLLAYLISGLLAGTLLVFILHLVMGVSFTKFDVKIMTISPITGAITSVLSYVIRWKV